MSRWLRFLIVLIIGFALGLLYGWVIDPVNYVDTLPPMLREDYQADYVLMVAETYQVSRDVDLAIEQLTFLGDAEPRGVVEQAMFFAVQQSYAPADLGALRALSDALQAETLPGEGNQP